MVRGPLVAAYLLGSLSYSARHPSELSDLVPSALVWHAALRARDIHLPLGVVLDLGLALRDGDDFHFRDYFAARQLPTAERLVREEYERLVIMRRWHEAAQHRLRALLHNRPDADLALSAALCLVLGPLSALMSTRYVLADEPAPDLRVEPSAFASQRVVFEEAIGRPGALLAVLSEVVALAPHLNCDQRLAEEDFYELARIRVFSRDSLRQVGRSIKRVERLLGPLGAPQARRLRERALARSQLSSVGVFPVGGIAELDTRGPLENLAASELVYLEPGAAVDLFGLRLAENELLRWLRDGANLHLMRRKYAFIVAEDDELFGPVTSGPVEGGLRGVKYVRCVLGLILALVADLSSVFAHDDVEFHLVLCQPAAGAMSLRGERTEIVSVLRLLLAEREAAGNASVEVTESPLEQVVADYHSEAGRATTLVVMGKPGTPVVLNSAQRNAGMSLVVMPVDPHGTRGGEGPGSAATSEAAVLSLGDQPVARLLAARQGLLSDLFQ